VKKQNQTFIRELFTTGQYFATTNGNIFSLKGKKPRQLKPSKRRDGYYKLNIYNKNVIKSLTVHHIVWVYFKGEIPLNMEINHKNGNKLDNRLDNLEVVTPSANTRHAISTGLKPHQRGDRNPNTNLTDKDVKNIRSSTKSIAELAKQYEMSYTGMWMIVKRKNWSHIE
jgi:hypothetical protein